MISNFVTTQEELDQFKQNDEKDYEEMDIEIEKWIILIAFYTLGLIKIKFK